MVNILKIILTRLEPTPSNQGLAVPTVIRVEIAGRYVSLACEFGFTRLI